MKLSEMRELLGAEGIQLTKSLGQNFLHDANQLRRIVDAAELAANDKVLEIGPGLGPLTERLLAKAEGVLAIEKDRRLVELLRRRFAGVNNLEIVHDDALEYLRRESADWRDWKLVANLPYSVASPILVELAQAEFPPKSMTATLQLEVVQRLTASVGSSDYGILTLLVQAHYEPAGFFKIPPGSFFPEPDVDSACVTLQRRRETLVPRHTKEAFVKIVKRSLSQRRKMMFKLLRADWPIERLREMFRAANIPEQARAEQVSLEQFAALATGLNEDDKHEAK
jgi:16S rRNA (adenine1518-N6/adenine1519-N6)-dimethyltransferase